MHNYTVIQNENNITQNKYCNETNLNKIITTIK